MQGVNKERHPVKKKQSLKKFFMLLILWFVTIICVVGGSMIYDRYKTSEYDDIAFPYIKRIIPELSKWDPATTSGLMAPEVLSSIPETNIAQAMTLFSRLGALQSIDEAKFDEVHEVQESDIGKQIIVEYNVDARYENGDAEINLKLLPRGGNFEIYRFNVSSEILLK